MKPAGTNNRALVSAATVLSITLVAVVTLWPQGIAIERSAQEVWCLSCRRLWLANAFANILLFVPLGAATIALFRDAQTPILRALSAGVVLSLLIEFVQYLGITGGRYASAVDVVCNASGALLGAVVWRRSHTLLHPSQQFSSVLALTSSIMVLTVFAVGGWAMSRQEPDASTPPAHSPLPYTTGYGWFEQQVHRGVVDGRAFDNRDGGALIVAAPVRDSQYASITAYGRDRRRGMVPMLFVHDPGQLDAHLMIAQRGRLLALQVGVRGETMGAAMPPFTIEDLATSGDTLNGTGGNTTLRTISTTVTSAQWSIAVEADSTRRNASIRMSPALAWMLAIPLRSANDAVARAGTVLFLIILFAPTGYWIAAAMQHGRRALVAASGVIVAAAFVVPPMLFAVALPSVFQVGIAMLSLAAASLLAGKEKIS